MPRPRPACARCRSSTCGPTSVSSSARPASCRCMAEVAREYTARDFLHPRYWPDWLALVMLRTVALLPLPLIWLIGAVFGELLYLIMPRRRHIARTNIRACFPQLVRRAQRRLVRAHFRAFTQAAVATPIAWGGTKQRLQRLGRMPGRADLDRAPAEKRPGIFLGGAFVALGVLGVGVAAAFL